MNLLVTVTAPNEEDLEWKVSEMKKLLLSQDMRVSTWFMSGISRLKKIWSRWIFSASSDNWMPGPSSSSFTVNGSASTFNQQTNVSLDNRYTVLDISSLTGHSAAASVPRCLSVPFCPW